MKGFLLLIGIVVSLSCAAQHVVPPKKEVRAVWLTTIYGLDWPRNRATDANSRRAHQADLCRILDRLSEANFNTVFFQVRLRGDVLYRSAIEPFAKILTERRAASSSRSGVA